MKERGETVVRACPVCDSQAAEPFLEKAGLRLVHCRDCSMVFVPAAGTEFAGGEFYETEGSKFYASEDKMAGDYSPVRYVREIRLLRKAIQNGRVLDVGCSTGGFLYFLKQQFPGDYEVLGNDVASGALAIAESNGIPVLRDSFFSLDATTREFDGITFWAVLEHVAQPRAFLQKARELLAPGGCCFVLVPNIDSLALRILGAKYRYILPQHLNYFSLPTLKRLVRQAGLEIAFSTSTHFNPVVIWQDLRAKQAWVTDQERAKLLVKTNALKRNPALAPLRWCYAGMERILGAIGLADNIVVAARKPAR